MNNLNYLTMKPRWQEHYNSVWACERIENIASRDGVQTLYDRLITNKVGYNKIPLIGLAI